jgi:hypothetical protein
VHPEAFAWVAQYATTDPVAVVDLGGRFINGSPRPLFPAATTYTVLDIMAGPNVDIVADAASWQPDRAYDVAVCCETFEHTPVWPAICATAFAALGPGGRFIVTTAAPGRAVHSGIDGGPKLHPGEHYANIGPGQLRETLEGAGFIEVVVDVQPSPADVRAVAVKPK